MQNLLDFVNRASPPIPWEEGDNIPWNEPGFSRRMLREHLAQEHDAASRRFDKVDRQVEWIDTVLLRQQPGRILDLGCGPGLYTERLAQRGHSCVGIDFSPASVEYARERAGQLKLPCTYHCLDLRRADFSAGYDLVMFIFGEFNVFRPADAQAILSKAWQALKPGGRLLLEVHTYDMIYQMGNAPGSWYSAASGLFSEFPHLLLEEHFWNGESQAATTRYFLIETQPPSVSRYAASYQAYSDDGYRALVSQAGFSQISIYPSLGGVKTYDTNELPAITAYKNI